MLSVCHPTSKPTYIQKYTETATLGEVQLLVDRSVWIAVVLFIRNKKNWGTVPHSKKVRGTVPLAPPPPQLDLCLWRVVFVAWYEIAIRVVPKFTHQQRYRAFQAEGKLRHEQTKRKQPSLLVQPYREIDYDNNNWTLGIETVFRRAIWIRSTAHLLWRYEVLDSKSQPKLLVGIG